MSKQTRAILKGYFQKGKIPTQQQFEDLIDSFFNLADDKKEEVSLFFFAPEGAVLKDSGDATLGWKSCGIDKITLEYVSGGERKFEENLPLQSELYPVQGIDETSCFTITGYYQDKLIAQQQLWITGGIGYDQIGIDFHIK